MSMILSIWCNCDNCSRICVCNVAHDWVPYPFCAIAMCDSKKMQSHSERIALREWAFNVAGAIAPCEYLRWILYNPVVAIKTVQSQLHHVNNPLEMRNDQLTFPVICICTNIIELSKLSICWKTNGCMLYVFNSHQKDIWHFCCSSFYFILRTDSVHNGETPTYFILSRNWSE